MKRTGAIILGAFIALTAILSSCSDDSENPGTAPTLPPASSMSVNLGNFPQNEGGRIDYTNTKTNFALAAGNVVLWQTILASSIVIPAAAFEEAFNHDFQYSESAGKWVSEYSVNVAGAAITAELYAEVTGETVIWEMYLSQEGAFDQFLWFSGESNLDNTGGEWVLYASPQRPVEVLTIDWDRVEGEAVNSLYTLVDASSTKNGSYIEYGVTTEAGYTHFYDVSITDSEDDDYDLFILYNEENYTGSVKSNAVFGDDAPRCWDEALEDTEC